MVALPSNNAGGCHNKLLEYYLGISVNTLIKSNNKSDKQATTEVLNAQNKSRCCTENGIWSGYSALRRRVTTRKEASAARKQQL